jgi:DNA modification methylase
LTEQLPFLANQSPLVIGQSKIYFGDSLSILKTLDSQSANLCVTSPPYFGLRDYKVEGQIGAEASFQDYIKKIVEVFHEVKRVLKDSGSCYLNLGDSYKNKNLNMIPERIALMMQEQDGWILRNKIVWYKRNHMPSSVEDRYTNSYEIIFFFSKSRSYYFDLNAVRIPRAFPQDVARRIRKDKQDGIIPFAKDNKQGQAWRRDLKQDNVPGKNANTYRGFNERWRTKQDLAHNRAGSYEDPLHARALNPNGKNPGDVWEICTRPYPGAHFATYPEELVEICVKSSCPQSGIVLDPFCGSGTTLAVAESLNRRGLGIELNPSYLPLIQKRLEKWAGQERL